MKKGIVSVSQILKEARQNLGLTLEDVAQQTYIKLPYLIALEEEQYEKLPAAVYTYGYIRQYAKLLKLDGADLVSQYQAQQENRPGRLMPKANRNGEDAEPNEPSPTALSPEGRGPSKEGTIEAAAPIAPSAPAVTSPPPRQEAPPPPAVFMPPGPPREERPARPAMPAAVPAAGQLNGRERETRDTDPSARLQAQHIVEAAQQEARQLRAGAERYAEQVLAQLEQEIQRVLQTIKNGRSYLHSRQLRRRHPE